MPTLITQEQRALLLANGAEFDRNEDFDRKRATVAS